MADMKDDLDDFWDISKLIPKKKTSIQPFSTHTPVSDVVAEAEVSENDGSSLSDSDRKLDFSAYKRSVRNN